ncbi:hypothetical protein FQA47_015770 [Oryzias melastigma]|uniref:Uncharacterized protein n=1 Tax=Oryzias melastigma TaxID=30732 RepID=A0A834C755_ORYME|nr:hypothetical protein FQA47_015770 [Oryzias melastigma]
MDSFVGEGFSDVSFLLRGILFQNQNHSGLGQFGPTEPRSQFPRRPEEGAALAALQQQKKTRRVTPQSSERF